MQQGYTERVYPCFLLCQQVALQYFLATPDFFHLKKLVQAMVIISELIAPRLWSAP